ncbi:hypothetical protein [Haloplanus salilacus]|uniref:hypothetical protein n=1 Tax=Haloplanus salilacus TaxID=2949994 RepID=UPI0030D270ED
MTVGRRKILLWIGVVVTTVSSGCAKVAVESTDEVGRFLGPFARLLGDILNGGSSQSETTSATPSQPKETATGISIEEDDLPNGQSTPEDGTISDESSAALFEIDDVIQLSGDEFAYWSIDLEQYAGEYNLSPTIDYSLIVQRGSAVDVVLMRADEFTHFKQGERYRYRGCHRTVRIPKSRVNAEVE